jgi:hypothetical protein
VIAVLEHRAVRVTEAVIVACAKQHEYDAQEKDSATDDGAIITPTRAWSGTATAGGSSTPPSVSTSRNVIDRLPDRSAPVAA